MKDSEPSRIMVMWETSSNTESWIDWGATNSLGTSTQGAAVNSQVKAQIHTVTLTGLTPATRNYYQVKIGAVVSDTFNFVSP